MLVKTSQDLVDLLLSIRFPGLLRAVQDVFHFSLFDLFKRTSHRFSAFRGLFIAQRRLCRRQQIFDMAQRFGDARQALAGNVLKG